MNEPLTKSPDAFAVIAFPESSSALFITSPGAAAVFGLKPRRFAAWVREQLAELGPQLSGEVQRLSFKTVTVALLAVRVDFKARAPVELVAAVLPDEAEAGEQALLELRDRLIALSQAGGSE